MATTRKKIGVWMNHSIAHLMEDSNNPFEVKTIESNFTNEEKIDCLLKGQAHLQHVEKEKQSKFYKKLLSVVKKYKEIILFGPSDAKNELFNVLSADNRFENIKIEVKQTDKMTAGEQHAFVRDFFANK